MIERLFDLLFRDSAADIRIVQHHLAEVSAFFPGAHGITLHDSVGIFADHARFHQVEQQLSAEHQSTGAVQVRLHALRIDHKRVDDVGGLIQQVIQEDGRIRQDDAFHRRMRNVALVPQRYVFIGSLHVGTHYARQSADLFAGNRVAFVRHGRRSLLLFAEIFFRLPNLRPL